MTLNEQNLYETTTLWYVPFWQTPLFYKVVVAVGIVLLLALLYFLVKKVYAARAKRVTPKQAALAKIEWLKVTNGLLVSNGNHFYSQLSLILKSFIACAYKLPVQSCTDDQLIVVLETNKFPAPFVNELKILLSGALYIKFANAQAAQEIIERDFQKALLLVRNAAEVNKEVVL